MINLILEFVTNSSIKPFELQEFFEEIKHWGLTNCIVTEYSYSHSSGIFSFSLCCQEKTSVWKFVIDIHHWKGWEINNVTINSINE